MLLSSMVFDASSLKLLLPETLFLLAGQLQSPPDPLMLVSLLSSTRREDIARDTVLLSNVERAEAKTSSSISRVIRGCCFCCCCSYDDDCSRFCPFTLIPPKKSDIALLLLSPSHHLSLPASSEVGDLIAASA